MSDDKKVIIVAGPNGAGKTTFATEYLPKECGCLFFVNADLIANGISPFTPDYANFQAGRIMIEEIKRHIQKGNNFGFETTLSGMSYSIMIPNWQQIGYKVKLIFLYLPDVSISIERVKNRVKQGGHNVPEDVIKRRFIKGWHNFQYIYKELVDEWILFDNSHLKPILLDAGGKR